MVKSKESPNCANAPSLNFKEVADESQVTDVTPAVAPTNSTSVLNVLSPVTFN